MLNVIALVGRLVADPELRYTSSGLPVASFRIAVDRPFKDADGKKQVDFINCVAWRQKAEFVANYLTKGRLVGIEGRLQIRQWEDKDGKRHWNAEVVCNQVAGLDRKPQEGQKDADGDPAYPDEPELNGGVRPWEDE